MVNTSVIQWALVMLGQAADVPADVADSVRVQSIWDFVVKGGPMMVPIGACSLIAVTIMIERLSSLRQRHIIPPNFLSGLKKVASNRADDREDIVEYCQNNDSPIARIFAAGVKRPGMKIAAVEKYVQEAGQREVLKMRRYLRGLSVIASIAPLMGLLGTIFGMITAFQTVAMSGESLGKAELLAKGIYQAMITTAAGLLVAIPVLVGYHWLSATIEQLVGEMDQMSVDFVEEYVPASHDEGSRKPHLQPVASSDGLDVTAETA
jgi:biopolymer transport protein ExbB